jgi:hypothetical protein
MYELQACFQVLRFAAVIHTLEMCVLLHNDGRHSVPGIPLYGGR